MYRQTQVIWFLCLLIGISLLALPACNDKKDKRPINPYAGKPNPNANNGGGNGKNGTGNPATGDQSTLPKVETGATGEKRTFDPNTNPKIDIEGIDVELKAVDVDGVTVVEWIEVQEQNKPCQRTGDNRCHGFLVDENGDIETLTTYNNVAPARLDSVDDELKRTYTYKYVDEQPELTESRVVFGVDDRVKYQKVVDGTSEQSPLGLVPIQAKFNYGDQKIHSVFKLNSGTESFTELFKASAQEDTRLGISKSAANLVILVTSDQLSSCYDSASLTSATTFDIAVSDQCKGAKPGELMAALRAQSGNSPLMVKEIMLRSADTLEAEQYRKALEEISRDFIDSLEPKRYKMLAFQVKDKLEDIDETTLSVTVDGQAVGAKMKINKVVITDEDDAGTLDSEVVIEYSLKKPVEATDTAATDN